MIGKFSIDSFTPEAIKLATSTVPTHVANAFIQLGQRRDLKIFYHTENAVTIGEYALELSSISPDAVEFVTSDDGQSLDDQRIKLAIIAAYKRNSSI
ncbi:hypothetical protein [Paenibacillus chibensis]|uniref:hypothetical protein n=1 Tax=Paenibacillus chibensis TaxID=59846 RepID=UPI000FD7E167|nr:hypothetical protein [Paenibacillus chibensis]MEC0373320.1 hypothetical protein [Paenibacillus chibensis]